MIATIAPNPTTSARGRRIAAEAAARHIAARRPRTFLKPTTFGEVTPPEQPALTDIDIDVLISQVERRSLSLAAVGSGFLMVEDPTSGRAITAYMPTPDLDGALDAAYEAATTLLGGAL